MRLRLESFDGPLDLLLHLIKSQEINIFNIPIALICSQYMKYLHDSPDLNYMLAGEYLAMAANLIELKAMTLVPALQNRLLDAQSLEQISDSDPRKVLVQALLEYETIKEAAQQLETLAHRDIYPSGEFKRRREEFENISEELSGNAFTLVIMLERMLIRYSDEYQNTPKVKVRGQKITIQSKMLQIRALMDTQDSIVFTELYSICESRYELIITIMALLEMSKSRHVHLVQGEIYGTILIEKGDSYSLEMPEIEDENTKESDLLTS